MAFTKNTTSRGTVSAIEAVNDIIGKTCDTEALFYVRLRTDGLEIDLAFATKTNEWEALELVTCNL